MKALLISLILFGLTYFVISQHQLETVKRNHEISRKACLTKYQEYKETNEIFSFMDCVRNRTSTKSHQIYNELKEKTGHKYLSQLFIVNDIVKKVQPLLLILPMSMLFLIYPLNLLFENTPNFDKFKYIIMEQYIFAFIWEYILYQVLIVSFRVLPLANTSGHLILLPFISYLLISNVTKLNINGILRFAHYVIVGSLYITLCFTAFIYHSFEDGLYSLPISLLLMLIFEFDLLNTMTSGSIRQLASLSAGITFPLIISHISYIAYNYYK